MSSSHAPSPSDFPPGYLAEYCGGQLLGTCIAFMLLGTIFVTLRFYTRLTTEAKQGWDDVLIVPALAANIALQGSCIALITQGGVGKHIEYWEINDPLVIFSWAKVLFVVELTYLLAVALGKLTILAIYLRIFNSKPMLYTTYIIIGIVAASWFGSTIAGIFQSLPVGCQWDPTAGANCHSFDILAFFRYLSIPNIVTDVVMLVLPLPMVWRLKLPHTQKIGLTCVFLTGSIGLVSSCVRFAEFFQANAFEDPTWKSSLLNVFTVTEPGTYLIASCLPALRPIFLAILHRLNPSRFSSGHGRSYGKRSGSSGAYGVARYARGSKGPNTFERISSDKRRDRSEVYALENVLVGAGEGGRFQRSAEDGISLETDERSLVGIEERVDVISPGEFEHKQEGGGRGVIEVRKDVDVVFSTREREPTDYELGSRGFGR